MRNTLTRRFRTAFIDLRFGGRLLKGYLKTSKSHLGSCDIEHSLYPALDHTLPKHIFQNDVLVDVGCGKGRVLNWWLSNYRHQKIYGIEWEENVAEEVRKRLKRYSNVTILTGDASILIPEDGSFFYLYNPFSAEIMQRFISKILERPRANNGLTRRIFYHNCLHRRHGFELLENDTLPTNIHPHQPPYAVFKIISE